MYMNAGQSPVIFVCMILALVCACYSVWGAEEQMTLTQAGITYHVSQAPNASDENPGTAEAPFRTVSHAAQIAQPGDTVLVHAGIYRECVRPVRGGTGPDNMITYQAAPGEKVILRGSELFSPQWQPVVEGASADTDFVKADLPEDFFEVHPRLSAVYGKPTIYNPFRTAITVGPTSFAERYQIEERPEPPRLMVGEVYAVGKPLIQRVTLEECRLLPGSYYISPDGRTLYVNFPLFAKGPVELPVREQVFAPAFRGLGYIRVRGFIMEQGANQGPFPQAGILSTHSGHHWIIEDNIIRYAATIGIDVGAELAIYWKGDIIKEVGPWAPGATPAIYEQRGPDGEFHWSGEQTSHVLQPSPSVGHIIRNNVISDNGLSGLVAIKADDLLIEGNVIERNNRRRLAPTETEGIGWVEVAGIKLHLTKNTIIRNNLVRDNWGWARGIWLDNNNDNARITGNLILNNFYGVDLEINTRPVLVDNNVIAFSRTDGLSSRDSITVKFIHNLVLHSGRWGCIINYSGLRGNYMAREFGPARGCVVSNNVFAGSVESRAIRIPMPTEESHDNIVAGNLISQEQQTFQLEEPLGGDNALSSAGMVAVATDWLTEANLPKDLWPDFENWQNVDRWSMGQCTFPAFDAIAGTGGNTCQDFAIPAIFARLDQFTSSSGNSPIRWPIREFDLPGLSPGYELQLDTTGWPEVESVSGIDTDYLGNGLDTDSVLPGPIQGVKGKTVLTIWPKSGNIPQK